MPDMPDFYMYMLSGTRAILQDMAELAARLHSPSTFSRSGQTAIIATPDNGVAQLNYTEQGSGTLTVSNLKGHHSGYSWVLSPYHATDDNYVEIEVTSRVIEYNKIGLEFSVDFTSTWNYLIFYLWYRKASVQYLAQIKVTKSSANFDLYKSDTTYVTVLTKALVSATSTTFHNIKLVIDTSTGYYVRLMVDNVSVDLSTYLINNVVAVDNTYLGGDIQFHSSPGNVIAAHVGHMIITTGEF